MKQLLLPFRISAVTRGTATISLTEHQVAHQNGGQVVTATLGVEKTLVMILATCFMPEGGSRGKEFEDRILNTSWCSFEAKRALVVEIAKERKLVPGDKLPRLEKALSKISEFRNAFAHGRIIQKDGQLSIHYYKGNSRHEELTDSFWTSIETLFEEANRLTSECLDELVKQMKPSPA